MKNQLNPTEWTHSAIDLFSNHKNAERAAAMAAYMKNRFPFYGIPKPERAEITKELFHEQGVPSGDALREIVCLLWDQPERELHYLALECLAKGKKEIREDDIFLYEELMRQHSWWDSIDFISPTLCGTWFRKFPQKREFILRKWNSDTDFWIRRASLLAQLKEKTESDEQLLFSLIIPLLNEKEFFIRKAIGWSLRELAKHKSDAVLSFVEQHELSPLSRREALKHLIKNNTL